MQFGSCLLLEIDKHIKLFQVISKYICVMVTLGITDTVFLRIVQEKIWKEIYCNMFLVGQKASHHNSAGSLKMATQIKSKQNPYFWYLKINSAFHVGYAMHLLIDFTAPSPPSSWKCNFRNLCLSHYLHNPSEIYFKYLVI